MIKMRAYFKHTAKFTYLLFLLLLLVTGCKSAGQQSDVTPKEPEPVLNELINYQDAMLWQINGIANDGSISKVYLLGTYHAGDDRVLELPECVSDALAESDRFCCELSSTDWAELPQMMQDLTVQSFLTDLSHTLIDDLTPDEITLINTFIDSQTFAQLVCFEPWVLNNYLQPVVMLAADLDSQKAYDVMIMDYIQKQKDDQGFEGLDDAQTQFDLIAYGDWDTQMTMLRDTLADLQHLQEAADEMSNLYEVFLSGDEENFEKFYFKDFENEIKKFPVYEEYFSLLLNQRNKAWAVKIADYLDQPGVTFIFAGCAHFVGSNSVFSYMRKNGDLN